MRQVKGNEDDTLRTMRRRRSALSLGAASFCGTSFVHVYVMTFSWYVPNFSGAEIEIFNSRVFDVQYCYYTNSIVTMKNPSHTKGLSLITDC